MCIYTQVIQSSVVPLENGLNLLVKIASLFFARFSVVR